MSKPHQDLEAVFQEAVEFHAPDTWERFLSVRCAGHEDLRSQASRLLRGYIDGDGFMARPVPSVLCPELPRQPLTIVDALPERFIGSYELLECLGEGGMGKVYLAEQKQPIRRFVALKMIKPGMDTWEIVRRFEAERQTLALMNHPGIAQVLEAGATDSGVPYFVMELVRGEPITRFCDRLSMNLNDRLQLMIGVCGAIQHAHQKGIVHQDLKPTNVLVAMQDGKPAPKIIDFGIARVIGPGAADVIVQTGFQHLFGTPGYMSPEQFLPSRQDTDIRIDVYSLGVLLYELITGSTPISSDAIQNAGREDVLRIMQEIELLSPSQRLLQYAATDLETVASKRGTDVRRLKKSVRGDLDWIVMKAVAKDQTHRYDTVASLAADLQRYFNHEPVLAVPHSAEYRLLKAWQKHRLLITLLILLAMTLSAGLGFSIRQAVVAQRAVLLSQTYLRITEERQRQFQNLAWRAGIREAYAAWERNQCFEANQALQAVRATDPVASSQLSWKLLSESTGQVYRQLLKTNAPLHELRTIPGTDLVAVAGEDGCVRIVDPQTGYVTREIKTSVPRLHALAVSADGKLVATGGVVDPKTDRSVPLVYEIATGNCLHELPGQLTTIESLEFSADGKFLACGSRYETVKNFEMATHAVAEIPSTRRNTWLTSTPDGRFLFSEETSTTVRVSSFDNSDGGSSIPLGSRIVTSLLHPQTQSPLMVTLGEKGSTLLSIAGQKESFAVQTVCTLQGLDGFPKFAVDEAASLICAGLEYGEVICYPLDSVNGEKLDVRHSTSEIPQLATFSRQHVSDHSITSMCFHKGWLLVTTFNGELLAVRPQPPVIEIKTSDQPLTPGENLVDTAVAADPDGRILLVGRSDGSVVRINVSGRPSNTAAEPPSSSRNSCDEIHPRFESPPQFPSLADISSPEVSAIAISRDQRKIAIIRNSRDVILIENGTTRSLSSLTPEMINGQSEILVLDVLAFSDDGKWLGWTGDRSLTFARIDGPEIQTHEVRLPGFGRRIAWSEDGSEIAVGGSFQAIGRVTVSDQSLHLEALDGSEVNSLRYLGNSAQLLTGHSDGSIQLRDKTKGLAQALHVHRSVVSEVAVSETGETGIAMDGSANIAVFSINNNERLGLLHRVPESVSPDSSRLKPLLILSEKSGFLRLISNEKNSTLTVRTWNIR